MTIDRFEIITQTVTDEDTGATAQVETIQIRELIPDPDDPETLIYHRTTAQTPPPEIAALVNQHRDPTAYEVRVFPGTTPAEARVFRRAGRSSRMNQIAGKSTRPDNTPARP